MNDCYSCRQTAAASAQPPRERIWSDGVWRVAHAIECALPGWVVVLPARHVVSPAELSAEEAAALGPLLRAVSRAVVDVTGCERTYLAMFAEKEGFQHLHVHVVPRHADLPDDRRGPGVFWYVRRPPSEWVSNAEMDRLAAAMAERIGLDH